jgi:sRNA-binding regulator protein Hfq
MVREISTGFWESAYLTNERMPMTDDKWGQSHDYFLASLRGKWVKIVLRGEEVLKGVLTGVDRYEVFIKPSEGPEIMVHKGAIKYMHQVEVDNQVRE